MMTARIFDFIKRPDPTAVARAAFDRLDAHLDRTELARANLTARSALHLALGEARMGLVSAHNTALWRASVAHEAGDEIAVAKFTADARRHGETLGRMARFVEQAAEVEGRLDGPGTGGAA